jgi:hypothetical protein
MQFASLFMWYNHTFRFLPEDARMHSYLAGDRVAHAQYGDGTVTTVDTYHTRIKFDAHGPRTFVTGRVVLTASATPAPLKAARRRKSARP